MPSWQELCKNKLSSRDSLFPSSYLIPTASLPPPGQANVISVPETAGILTDKEIDITRSNVDEILIKIAQREWTSKEVTVAFCKRASISNQLSNCLTEIFFDSAIQQAEELDEYLLKEGRPIGPLHGLPISFKDQFDIEGVECTMGYASWIGRISEQDCTLVQILRNAGAVFYVKTNLPQTIMSAETDNLVFGQTTNPRNRSLTCGGSTGGEGALIALRGSVAGFGTDIGGSIRIPAAFCGIYGLRPTMRRMPYRGVSNSLLGFESIESSIGPMSSSLPGLKTLFKTVLLARPWELDPKVVEIPWMGKQLGWKNEELCIGVIEWDGLIRPHPPVQRALRITAEAAESAGIRTIQMTVLDALGLTELVQEIFAADGGEDFRTVTKESGEPLIDGSYWNNLKGLSVYELHQLNQRRDTYRQRWLDYLQSTRFLTGTGRPVDGILCPCAPHVAAPQDEFYFLNYTNIWNCLDYPSVVFPVTSVDPQLDVADLEYIPVSKNDELNWSFYDPAKYTDAPVNVQLVGKRWGEEHLLNLTEIVEKALQNAHNAQV